MTRRWPKKVEKSLEREIPRSGSKAKDGEREKERKKERLNDGNNNGHLLLRIATPPRVAHGKPPGPIKHLTVLNLDLSH